MPTINALLMLGLLASVDAQFYRGLVRDYNDRSYATTQRYVDGDSSSKTGAGADEYDYTSSIYTEQRNPTSTPDYVYDATQDDNTASTYRERTNPTDTNEASSYDYTPSTFTERNTNLEWNVAER